MSAAVPRPRTDALPRNRLTSAFERRVGRVIGAHVPSEASIVVACSGGPDSTAALIAVTRVREASGAPVIAACFDHRMRPAAETLGDRAFVQEIGAGLGIRVRVGTAREQARPGGEAAARAARYRWLGGICDRVHARVCVTGHTREDQAETVLLRLTRGAGLAGASGMAESAPWPVKLPAGLQAAGLRVVRPLLQMGREEILHYLDALELEAREDGTNQLLAFDRNRVRQRVMAELRRINPRASEQLARFARLARADDEALAAWAAEALPGLTLVPEAVVAEERSDRVALERQGLAALPAAVSSRILRHVAEQLGLQLESEHVGRLLEACGRRVARVSLPGAEAWAEERALVIERRRRRPSRRGG
ncbi:MAG: tRNA lysidine(34) synthetase TilS [Chloroflexi bacterium]|nr:tRNA lysidine(34) synthetase TilS [Chloroflexota bacterium]